MNRSNRPRCICMPTWRSRSVPWPIPLRPARFRADFDHRTPCWHSWRAYDYGASQASDKGATGSRPCSLREGRHNSAGGIIPAKIPFARLSSRAKASCLPIQLLAHMRVRIFIRWSSQQKPTASIRIAISPGCSSGCLWQRRSTTTTRCFPGSCRPTYADPRSHHMSHAPSPELRGVADGPHTIWIVPANRAGFFRPRSESRAGSVFPTHLLLPNSGALTGRWRFAMNKDQVEGHR